MVRITKIYTRGGDAGSTGLGTGRRVSKDDARVEAYGEVDEANASIGLAACEARAAGDDGMLELLTRVQNDLFDVGADLCMPIEGEEAEGASLRVLAGQTEQLERDVDRYNEDLEPLNSFVLPGGTRLATALHVARTVTRRAERRAVTLFGKDEGGTNPETVRYLNRLSDLLFVLARVANDGGKADVLWVPGKHRPGASEDGSGEGGGGKSQ